MGNVAKQVVGPSDPAGYVQLSGVTISANVTFDDAEIVEILTQVAEGRRVDFFIRAARSGLIAMGNDVTTRFRESIKFFQSSIDGLVTSFGDRMAEKLRDQLGDAEKDGHVQERLHQILDAMSTELKGEMEKALPDVFDKQTKKSAEFIQAEGERVMRQIAALFAENGIAFNVIQEARRDFALRLEEVKTAVTVSQTKAANPTPRDAGLSYEAWVHGQLATIGSLRGDDVEFTAGKAGKISRCLKGDSKILVSADATDVTAPPCIAVEIRDREESEFSLADVETMVRNRDAEVAVVIAAHPGSLPRQYADRSFCVSRRKRLITLVLGPESTESEVVLAAAYHLASALAIEVVRRSRDGDWDAVARKVDEIEQAVEGIVEARTALGQIERKAHDAGAAADKRHALLVRLVAELVAVVRTQ
jgi:hypothetical protein